MFNTNLKKACDSVINFVTIELENNDVRLKEKDAKIECNLKLSKWSNRCSGIIIFSFFFPFSLLIP